jgi:hypothetical protein
LKEDLQEGLSTSIDARSGLKEPSPVGFVMSKVALFPGRIVGLVTSNSSGAVSATLLLIVGMVFFTNWLLVIF